MDQPAYTAATQVCARLAGRMSDDALDAVRVYYAAGEWTVGDDTLLLTLAFEQVGITTAERNNIRLFLSNPDSPDLAAVPAAARVPALPYQFSPTGPGDAPDPAPADRQLAGQSATYWGGRGVFRSWRQPLPGAPNRATWQYLMWVPPGTDLLRAYSSLSSQLWADLKVKWQIEAVIEGAELTPYQAAAMAGAQFVVAT